MFRFSTAAVACALAFSASTSFAASQSSASISGLTFTLIDLNPRDNIAPSFSFVTTSGSTVLTISATDNFVGESDSASRTRAGTFSFTKEYLTDLANASASGSLKSDSLTVSGQANGPQTSYSASASTGSTGYYSNQALNLTLSANTLLLIDANVDLSAAATNPQSCTYYYCYNAESASASASLGLSYNYSATGVSTSYNANQSLSLLATATGGYQSYSYQYNPNTGWYEYVYFDVPGTEQDKSLNDILSAVFTNSSSSTQSAALSLSVNVSGSANTAPRIGVPTVTSVPEADTLALGLAGLGVVGLILRRRQG